MNEANKVVGFTGNVAELAKVQHLMDKFAELIIKECGRELESYDPDFDWATVALKKHFGIKDEPET